MLEELKAKLDEYPKPEDFKEPIEPFFVDLTFAKFFEVFFTFGVQFDIEAVFQVYKDTDLLLDTTDWFEPTEDEFMTSFG